MLVNLLPFEHGKCYVCSGWLEPKNSMQLYQRRFVQSGSIRGKKGYTLVEVLCAIVIAAISASVLFVGFDNGFALLRTTREDLRATQILMQKTEAFRLYTWQALTNVQTQLPSYPKFTEYYYPPGSGNGNQGTLFVGTLSLTGPAPFTNNYSGNLHLITITLRWTNYVGKNFVSHERQMQTLSARYGMQSYLYNGN